MKKNFFIITLLIPAISFLVLTSACTTMPEGNPENGERWFRMNRCNGCHGEKGIGEKGPQIAGLQLSYRRFINKVRKPNSAIMPTFTEKQLSNNDAADIYLWLKTLKKQ